MDNDYAIVVGIDGSEGSRRALRWAIQEAARRAGVVRAVTVWRPTDRSTDLQALEQHAEEMVRTEAANVQQEIGSHAPVTAEAIKGTPAEVLAEVAREANLLVIGSHGFDRAWHQLMGSTAEECIRHAQCPVVIIPVPHQHRQ